MSTNSKVRSTQIEIPQHITVDVDTVYVRSNIVPITEEKFTGWEYDEIQYNKDIFIGIIMEKNNKLGIAQSETNTALLDLMEITLLS